MATTGTAERPILTPARLSFLLYACAGLADGMVVPFFPLWARGEAGIPIGLIGLLFGCYAGGELLAAPLIGGIADRAGRRPVLIASSLGVGLGFMILPLVHGVVLVAALLVGIGLFESVLHPTIATVIADSTPPAEHHHQFGVARASSSIGGVLGPALGAWLATRALHGVFVAAGAGLVAAGLLALLKMPETRDPGQPPADGEEEEEGISALVPAFRDRRLAMLLLWFMLLEVAGSWIESVLPLYAHDHVAFTVSQVGLLFTYGAVLTALAQIPLVRLARRRSSLSLVVAAGAVMILAFVILLGGATAAAMIAAVTLFSLSQMLVGPLIPATVNQLAPVNRRASYMAAASVATDLRDSLGPASGTALYAVSTSLPWMIGIPFAGVAAAGLAAAVARGPRPAGTREDRRRRRRFAAYLIRTLGVLEVR